MVSSRDKGKRAEYAIRDMLRDATGLQWERVPGSGGLMSSHGLKGDVYVPDTNIKHCVEVKHYKDDVINYLMLKNPDNQFAKFWAQTVRESGQVGKEPLLFFKKDRGQWSVATRVAIDHLPELKYTGEFREDKHSDPFIDEVYIYLATAWITEVNKDYFL